MPAPSPGRPSRRPGRRRQRSVRVTVAVGLLTAATVAVLASLPSRSPGWIGAAAIASLVCGWAAARIVYTELTQSRREHAADRAAQAAAYRTLFADRADEHAAFTTSVTDKLRRTDDELRELSATLVAAEQRAADAEQRAGSHARRADEAESRLTQLQGLVETVLATAEATPSELHLLDRRDDLADLLAWEQQATELSTDPEAQAARKHA